MKAALFQALHHPLVVEDIAEPRPAADEVVVRVGRCGICGSDLHMTEEPAFGVASGTVLGHEFAGEIVELGPDVQGLRLGDRVAVAPLRGCGNCPTCLAGEPAWCARMSLQGGGYAELALDRSPMPAPAALDLARGRRACRAAGGGAARCQPVPG